MTTPSNHSVIKAFAILRLFKGQDCRLSLAEIAEATGFAVSTTHRFLRTLVSIDVLDHRPDGSYALGEGIRHLAAPAHERTPAEEILGRHVSKLSSLFNETVHMGMRHNDMVRYIAKAECSRSLRTATRVGTELEAYCTGLGKILFAGLPNNEVSSYLKQGEFVRLTDRTITQPDQLLKEFARVREQGYALDDEEFEEGLRCLAVPVSIGGEWRAALSVSAPATRLKDERIPGLVEELRRRAALISEDIATNPSMSFLGS